MVASACWSAPLLLLMLHLVELEEELARCGVPGTQEARRNETEKSMRTHHFADSKEILSMSIATLEELVI